VKGIPNVTYDHDPHEDEEDDDHWQEFKDGIAMGYHDRYGNPLDPPEPDADEVDPQFPDEGWEPEPPAIRE
jgi:hypothetical protein